MLHLANTSLGHQAVDLGGGPGLAVRLNTGDAPASFPLDGQPAKRVAGTDDSLPATQLGPHSWAVLNLTP